MKRRVRIGRIIGPVASVVLFGFAVLAIRHFLRDHSFEEIVREAKGQERFSLVTALGLTALSYFVLTGYDWLALRYIRRRLEYRRVGLTSFICYALSHNIGMSVLSGGSARYRIYSTWGIGVIDAAKIILFCNMTFWVGFFAVGSFVLTTQQIPIPAFSGLPFATSETLGLICIAMSLLLLGWVAFGPRTFRIRGLDIRMPFLRTYVDQIVVSSLDWMVAAAVLHVLLPSAPWSYADTLGLFLLAQIVAMASNVPGGMGVFESLLLYLAGDRIGVPELLGALIVYRLVYYFVPLAFALLLLTAQEWRRRRRPRAAIG